MKTIFAPPTVNASFKRYQPLPRLDTARLDQLAQRGARAAARWDTLPPTTPTQSDVNGVLLGLPLLRPDHTLGERIALGVLALTTFLTLVQTITAALAMSGQWYLVQPWMGRLIG